MAKTNPYTPAWELTRRQYYRMHVRKEFVKCGDDGYLPVYFLPFRPREPLSWQESIDFAAFDREGGHYFKILRQIERSQSLEYLTPFNLITYFPMFMKYFREHPELVRQLKPWRAS